MVLGLGMMQTRCKDEHGVGNNVPADRVVGLVSLLVFEKIRNLGAHPPRSTTIILPFESTIIAFG